MLKRRWRTGLCSSPIALIGPSQDPCQDHQVLAYECPYQPGDKQTVVTIYDVNYARSGYDINLDFQGGVLNAAAEHPYDPRPYTWEPLNGLFCEAYKSMRPNP
jgi:hypothetical protein